MFRFGLVFALSYDLRKTIMPVKRHQCKLTINENGYETAARGSPMFPCSAYWWDLTDSLCSEIPCHWHEDIEVLFVKSGSLKVSINDMSYILERGEGAFINSNVVHSIRTAMNEVSTLNSLVLSTDILSGTIESVFNQHYIKPLINCCALPFIRFRLNDDWEQKAAKCILDAYTAFDKEMFGYELVIRENLSQMLYLIITNNQDILQQENKSENKDITRLKSMIRYIHENYRDRIKLQHIAAAANVSERECLRCFKNTIGITPVQFLLKYRVSVAARLLTDSQLNITEICDNTGFDNPSHFSRAFRLYMQCSPTEFRKRSKGIDASLA